jgi:predicted anti-sigma-YlaC factor YlaD
MEARCEETRELLAELALGVADGEERGRALQHLAECPDCRMELEKLSDVADELSLLAPHREVPVGFESRVLANVLPAPPPRRRRRRLGLMLAPVAAAAAAVAITLAVVSGDLRDASHYRHTLDTAHGREFESYRLYGGGTQVGTVFSYQGNPDWLLITVDPAHRADLNSAVLVKDDGSQVPLSWFHLDGSGSSGGGIPVDPHHVSVLRLLPGAGDQPLVAHFNS